MKHALPDLHDREVLILGMGASGLALARWCVLAGARVTVADSRAEPQQAPQWAAELPQVRRLHAAFDADLLAQAPWALIGRSPGIAPDQMQALTEAASRAGIAVCGELDLFAQALAALAQPTAGDAAPYRPWVLAITGTNGKTTTTALTAHLLNAAGCDAKVAGNIGPTLLDELRTALLHDRLPQAWVLELSSFQLDGVAGFEPSAATVLNLSQDHLDWHGSMAAYAQAKHRVFGATGAMVLNRDDAQVMQWAPPAASTAASPRSAPRKPAQPQRAVCTFGTGLPQRVGDWGLEMVNGMTWLVRAVAHDGTTAATQQQTDVPCQLQRLMPAEALRIRGRHNATNALAALALASATGVALAPLLHGLRDYAGEPHRVESVGVFNDVEYIDDSKGTNVGATLAAINGLGPDRGLVLIMGGQGKGQDFTPLVDAVARYAKAVALIGADAPQLAQVLHSTGVPLQQWASLPEAVRWCAEQARPGQAVVLSPACASLDMFRDYAHRAQVFVQTLRQLQQEQGVAV